MAEEPGWGLTRRRAAGWPTADRVAALREHAVDPSTTEP
jgi:hypothetical protein